MSFFDETVTPPGVFSDVLTFGTSLAPSDQTFDQLVASISTPTPLGMEQSSMPDLDSLLAEPSPLPFAFGVGFDPEAQLDAQHTTPMAMDPDPGWTLDSLLKDLDQQAASSSLEQAERAHQRQQVSDMSFMLHDAAFATPTTYCPGEAQCNGSCQTCDEWRKFHGGTRRRKRLNPGNKAARKTPEHLKATVAYKRHVAGNGRRLRDKRSGR